MYPQAAGNPIAPPQPKPSGVHESTLQAWNRLTAANDAMMKMLARMRGSQPEQANPSGAANVEVSVLGTLGNTNLELARLEDHIQELASLIG